MKGVCIDAGTSAVLSEGVKYFLFEHGENNFYVSKFNNAGAHCGSYQRKYFQVVEDEQPILPTGGLMVAEITKKYKGYGFNVGDRYIVGPTKLNQGTHFDFYDFNLDLRGCMPVDLFRLIEPYNGQVIKPPKTAQIEPIEQPTIKTPTKEVTAEITPNLKPKKEMQQSKPEQLTIFDFL